MAMATTVRDFTALISDDSWTGMSGQSAFFTYSFPDTMPTYLLGEFGASAPSYRPFAPSLRADVANAFSQLEAAVGVRFFEVAEGGTLSFHLMDFVPSGSANEGGFAYSTQIKGLLDPEVAEDAFWGDVFLNTGEYDTVPNDTWLTTVMHEIGHALGFDHPHDGQRILAKDLDTSSNTVMSYNGPDVATWQHMDLDGLRRLYGTSADFGKHLTGHAFDAATGVLSQTAGDGAQTLFGVFSRDVLRAGAGDDTVYASLGADTVFAGEGDDKVDGGAGDDVILAGAGADSVTGGAGADTIYMGAGDDTVSAALDDGADVIGGGVGSDVLMAGAGADTVFGGQAAGIAGADVIEAGAGADLVFGGRGAEALESDRIDAGAGRDTVYAGVGADSLVGGMGDDLLFGGSGADTIDADAGNDTIWGGAGNDALQGFGGADVFGFAGGSGSDTIFDFSVDADVIWLTGTATRFASLADVQAAASGTVLDLGGGATLQLNIALAALGEANFLFG